MAVETLELSHDTGTVLECTTTGNVFGFRFDVGVDVVEQFLSYLRKRGLDARTLDFECNLRGAWDEFKAGYKCATCGEGSVEMDDVAQCDGCGKFHCGQHSEDDEWSDTHDGKTTEYGHKC